MAIDYSPEQNRIFECKQGGVIVVANAGTGKTTSTAQLILRRYLEEEKKLYPREPGHVGGRDQERILRQFLCVTFTVKAAAELDAKIKSLFRENGIPMPIDGFNKPIQIARTLDSYVRRWLLKPAVFARWMDTDQATFSRLKDVLAVLPSATRDRIGVSGSPYEQALTFAKKWNWVPSDAVTHMLLDLSIRHEENAPLPDCDVNRWAGQFNSMLEGLAADDSGRLSHEFWSDKVEAWKRHQSAVEAMQQDCKQGRQVTGMTPEEAKAQIMGWERLEQMKDEFLSVLELARARGFHPVYTPELVTSPAVEKQLAAGMHLVQYRKFLNLAERWHRLKTHFLLREFGDQTTTFVGVIEKYRELMERDREYPSMIRTKYVFWDEVQDNSDFQHRILKFFFAVGGIPYLSVAIGDPKQQIYCWRGASPREFLGMIERKRSKEPSNLIGLTCSFRSAKSIVTLGNEIITTLPSYRNSVSPSSTIYQEEGEVIVSRPLMSIEEEAEWAMDRVEHYLASTTGTIMIVSRSSLSDHPLMFRHLARHHEFNKRISVLTIHRAKGLEADTVIALGLVAGAMPDYRSNSDEEVNLFYVACTRAKRTLLLSGLIAKREINEAGKVEDTVVGPTPFFARLPSLKALCRKASWTDQLLASGVTAQNQLLAAHLSQVDIKRQALQRERNTLFPTIEIVDESTEAGSDYGVTEADPGVAAMKARTLGNDATGKKANLVSARLRERVLTKLVSAYKLVARVPRLSSDEFQVALRSGWVMKAEGEKYWSFSSALINRAKEAKTA